jgi:hypothetical protein
VLDLGSKLAARIEELELQQDDRELKRTKLNALKERVEKYKTDVRILLFPPFV